MAAAAHKYTILTVGDGLAALISSVLITFSAGIVVTRVASSEEPTNVGADIGQQLFGNPKTLVDHRRFFARNGVDSEYADSAADHRQRIDSAAARISFTRNRNAMPKPKPNAR